MVKLFIALLALLAGAASSTQGLYNGYWKEALDLKTVLLANALVVLFFVALFYLLDSSEGVKSPLEKMDLSLLVGGACGFFIIMAFAIPFPSIGALASALLFIIAFLTTSILYDNFGVLNLTPQPITLQRIIGVLLVIIGTFLSLKSSLHQ